MKKFITFVITVFTISNNCFAQWIQQSSGTTSLLKGVFFMNENTGTVVGDNGKILRTTNGGSNWTSQSSGTPVHLSGVYFLNANTGTVVGEVGTIRKTTNGGINWISQSSGTINHLISVCFTDVNTGTAVGNWSTILRTTDGGTNWIPQTIGTLLTQYLCVDFVNANTGTVVDFNGRICKTTNGGTNWTLYISGADFCASVSFADENTGVVVGGNFSNEGMIFRTTNGGTNWIAQSNLMTMHCVFLMNANTGIIVGNGALRTTNSGETWTSNGVVAGYSVYFVNSTTGTVVGELGNIFRTTNGGSTFVSQVSIEIPERFFLSQNYPNPFNPKTNIKLDLPNKSFVKLVIYDMLGKEVSLLINEKLDAGSYQAEWNASDFPSGVYIYKIETESFVQTKSMVLTK